MIHGATWRITPATSSPCSRHASSRVTKSASCTRVRARCEHAASPRIRAHASRSAPGPSSSASGSGQGRGAGGRVFLESAPEPEVRARHPSLPEISHRRFFPEPIFLEIYISIYLSLYLSLLIYIYIYIYTYTYIFI